MKYEEIRKKVVAKKQSHQNEHTECISYGDFAVCRSGNGRAFIVDEDIADDIKHRKWSEDSHGYKVSNVDGELVRLHDYVMAKSHDSKPANSYVDHINQDKNDDRRCNLRFVTPYESSLNMPRKSNNTSGYIGVSYAKREGKFRSYINVNGVRIELGRYETAEAAYEARKEAEERYGFLSRDNTVLDRCERNLKKKGRNNMEDSDEREN